MTNNRRIDAVDYDRGLLAMVGLERSRLPDLVPPGTVIGSRDPAAADELGIPAGLPVATGSGDVHSAVIGSGAVADLEAHLYIGTSSWISGHVPFKKTDALAQRRVHSRRLAGKYVVVDEHETAGACLTFVRDNLGWFDDFDSSNAMAAGVAPGSGRCSSRPG